MRIAFFKEKVSSLTRAGLEIFGNTQNEALRRDDMTKNSSGVVLSI